MRSVQNVSVVFPAFNEEENIGSTVKEAIHVLSGLGLANYAVIVVNDGSTDNTAAEVEKLKEEHFQVHLVNQPVNMGYGAAIRRGFQYALQLKNDWVFFTDSDGQFFFSEITGHIREVEFEGVDMVIGFRIHRADPAHRKLFAAGWTRISKLILGFTAKDVDCAFKLISREVLENITLTGEGAAVNPELLSKATRLGFTYSEVGVHHKPRLRGEQSGSNPKVIIKSFVSLARIGWNVRMNVRRTSHPRPQAAE